MIFLPKQEVLWIGIQIWIFNAAESDFDAFVGPSPGRVLSEAVDGLSNFLFRYSLVGRDLSGPLCTFKVVSPKAGTSVFPLGDAPTPLGSKRVLRWFEPCVFGLRLCFALVGGVNC